MSREHIDVVAGAASFSSDGQNAEFAAFTFNVKGKEFGAGVDSIVGARQISDRQIEDAVLKKNNFKGIA